MYPSTWYKEPSIMGCISVCMAGNVEGIVVNGVGAIV